MFCLTLRKDTIKKFAAIALCGAVLVGSALGVSAIAKAKGANAPVNAVPQQKISGAGDIANFLAAYKIDTDPTTAEVISVKIPRKWDDSFTAFNEVIRQSGLDLTKFKGKKADKWMILSPSLCTETEKAYSVLLVYKNEPIGAYLIKKPSGEVSAMVLPQAQPLTDGEKAANAGFGDAAQSAPVDGDVQNDVAVDAPADTANANDKADVNAAAQSVPAAAAQSDAAQANADAPAEDAMPTE